MQLTLNFEAGLTETHGSCREVVQSRAYQQGRPFKSVAADMDYGSSQLNRKLTQTPGDSARFTVDDLELFLQHTGDLNPIFYLVEKYCKDSRIEELEREIARMKSGA